MIGTERACLLQRTLTFAGLHINKGMFMSNASNEAHGAGLGVWDAISIIVGIVIGTTIFELPWLIFANTPNPWMGLLGLDRGRRFRPYWRSLLCRAGNHVPPRGWRLLLSHASVWMRYSKPGLGSRTDMPCAPVPFRSRS